MSGKMLVLLTAVVASLARDAAAAELNTLKDLKVVPTAQGAQVIVRGSRAPTFTVFRLSEPDRLVVDLSSADASAVKGTHDGKGPVAGVVASQFADERASVARVLLNLAAAAQYDVRAEGNTVVISVDAAAAKPTPVANAPAISPTTAPVALESEEVAEAPVRSSAGNVVNSQADERKVTRPAQKVTAISYGKDTLKVSTDGELARYELIELTDPPRLALDLYGVTLAARAPKTGSGVLKEIRIGAHAEKVRLVLDLRGEMPAYEMARTSNGLKVLLGDAVVASNQRKTAAPVAAKAAPATPAKVADSVPAPVLAQGISAEPELVIDGQKVALESAGELAPLPVKPSGLVDIKDLSFDDVPSGGRIELKLSADARYKIDRPDERSAVLTLEGVRLPKKLERSLDTSALDTPVKMISAFPVSGDRVRVVVAGAMPLDEAVVKTATGLSWRLSLKGVKTEEVATSVKTAGFSSEESRYAAAGAPQRARYIGKKVSFEFKDIDIHNLLRIIAEVSKKNVVVADDVSGRVTIRLRNVPWDQALELILRSKGLGKEDLGNIIRVAPLKTLEDESKLREERKKSMVRQEDLVVALIPVNYATAQDMSSRVKDVLSERGSVTVDTRTNVLIVRDIQANMGKARSLVQNLDTQTPQVLIESRIVEANTSFSKQVGVQWGGAAQAAPGTGNPTGLVFPNTVAVRGGSSSTSATGTAESPNFAVNLPAAVGTGFGGALGFVFGSAGGALALNLRLSALENQGTVKTISAPKVTTLDNSPAKISQGISIPFSQVSAAGVNTTFIEARLSLDVLPHITQDGSILMTIKAENNQPDPSSTGANGQPAIQRKEANTQVLVKDGDTTVIGGIYVRRGSTSTAMVPFLGRIPVLGFFFKNHVEQDTRQELLIFITPRIINRQTIAQNL